MTLWIWQTFAWVHLTFDKMTNKIDGNKSDSIVRKSIRWNIRIFRDIPLLISNSSWINLIWKYRFQWKSLAIFCNLISYWVMSNWKDSILFFIGVSCFRVIRYFSQSFSISLKSDRLFVEQLGSYWQSDYNHCRSYYQSVNKQLIAEIFEFISWKKISAKLWQVIKKISNEEIKFSHEWLLAIHRWPSSEQFLMMKFTPLKNRKSLKQ